MSGNGPLIEYATLKRVFRYKCQKGFMDLL